MSRVLLLTLVAALVVFAVVQDRLTAAAARRYVTQQRALLQAGEPPIAVDTVMQPAISGAVRTAAVAAGAVLVIGCLAGLALRRAAKPIP